MAKQLTTTTALEDTPHRRKRSSNNNGYSANGSQPGLQACGRYSIPDTPIIFARGDNGRRGWLSTVYEPEQLPRPVTQLWKLLTYFDAIHFAPRRRVFDFPAAEPSPEEKKLIAERWRLVGTPALRVDRSARRKACALALRTNGAVGDARSELQVEQGGAAFPNLEKSKPLRNGRTRRLVDVGRHQALQTTGAAA